MSASRKYPHQHWTTKFVVVASQIIVITGSVGTVILLLSLASAEPPPAVTGIAFRPNESWTEIKNGVPEVKPSPGLDQVARSSNKSLITATDNAYTAPDFEEPRASLALASCRVPRNPPPKHA